MACHICPRGLAYTIPNFISSIEIIITVPNTCSPADICLGCAFCDKSVKFCILGENYGTYHLKAGALEINPSGGHIGQNSKWQQIRK